MPQAAQPTRGTKPMTQAATNPKLIALCQYLDIPTTHWSTSNGIPGCIPDDTATFQTKAEAVDYLVDLLDLTAEEADDLRSFYIVRFAGERAHEVGAHYCQVEEHLGPDPEAIEEDTEDTFTHDGDTYTVLNDSEADACADERMESYIDECILPDIPDQYHYYFDRDAWKRDALLSDGRDHCIGVEDSGEEYITDPETGKAEWFFIYRQ